MTSAGLGIIDEKLGKEKEYWLQKLSGELAATGVPIDYERSNAFTYEAGVVDAEVSDEAEAKLLELCGKKDLPAFIIFLGALKICLRKYTGDDDIIVGTAIHERYREITPLNTILALRDRVSDAMTVKKLLEQVKGSLYDAYANQKYPFDRILKLLKLERPANRTPLFNVAAVMDGINDRGNIARLGTDMTLVFSRGGGRTAITFEFNLRLFKRETVELFAEHYQRVLRDILANQDIKICELNLLSEERKRKLLFDYNATQRDYPKEKTICQLFEEQASRTPLHCAVVFEGNRLTYQELNNRADDLARYLWKSGVGRGSLVGFYLEHSIDMVVGVFGVLKAGAAYVPLDPEHPKGRLAYIINDAQICVALTQQSLADRLRDYNCKVICLDSGWEPPAGKDDLFDVATTRDIAYMIYTSGSTGEPKGAPISHGSLVNYIWWAKDAYLRGERLSFALYSSLAFDLTVTSIYTPLITGNQVVVYRRRGIEPPLEEILTQGEVGVLKLTPSHLSFVKERDNRLSSVKRLIVGGEALETKLARDIYDSFGGKVEIFNEYGPTETTVGCMIHLFNPDLDVRAFVPIGRPAANVQIYVLDSSLRPVAENVIGELYVAGDGLAPEYWNRPELTDARFVANPFARGQKMYKTGDLAKWLPEGVLDFVGRADDQVKFHGHRVELSEIQSVLNRHPEIRASLALVTKDQHGHDVMMAYYVSRRELEAADLRGILGEHLLQETIPNIFVHMKKLPLTLNGKINYRALPTLQEARQRIKRSYLAPRTHIEETLAGIWAEVLGVEQVGVYDNFFELGGDSILSIRIIARANQAGLRLTPKQLFQHQTIAELAEAAGAVKDTLHPPQSVVTGPVPLTPVQRWFFEQNLPDQHHYNQAILLEVEQGLDPALIEKAVVRLLQYHDSLRLRFHYEESGWLQINVAPDEVVPVTRVDLSLIGQADRVAAMEATAEQLQASLDLSSGPLLRVAWFDMGTESASRLLIIIHHLVIDGISWRILMDDLQTALLQLRRGEEITLPPKTTSFQGWARRLTQYSEGPIRQEADYWLAQMQENVSPLPLDYAGGENTVQAARTVSVSLSVEETRQLLRDAPEAYHTQINDLLLTSLVQAFSQWTGAALLLVDLEGHGREELFDDVDLSRTVGWFTSIFPAHLKFIRGGAPADALKSVKEQLRGIPNRGVSFGLLRYLSGNEDLSDRLSALPKAQVSFNYLGQLDEEILEGSPFAPAFESTGRVRSPKGRRAYLIEVDGRVIGGQLRLDWTYCENAHRRSTIQRLAETYAESLRSLITHCVSPEAGGFTPSDFPLAALDQRRLDDVLRQVGVEGRIEDIYPLSPLQEGLLFHNLISPQSGLYVTQAVCALKGVDIPAFDSAWRQALARHPILRTSFLWENLERPLQVVKRDVDLPIETQDWRGLDFADQQERLQAYLQEDRNRGFDFAEPPLMRLALFRVADTTYQFVWTHHHILLDGWSMYLVIKDLLALYDAFCQGERPALDSRQPFKSYIAWLQQQDLASAEGFWRQMLQGVTAPTPLPVDSDFKREPDEQPRYELRQARLSAELTSALQSMARKQRLTLNTLVQGAWALLLGRYSGAEDVVFGSVVSGRAAELAGIESMIGLFINTLPARLQISHGDSTLKFLSDLQGQQVEMYQYHYSPLAQVQKWGAAPQQPSLFESIFVFENYPIDPSVSRQSVSVEIQDFQVLERTHYALSLAPGLQPELVLPITYDNRRFQATTIARALLHLQAILEGMAADMNQPVSNLPSLTEVERQQLLIEWNDTQSGNKNFPCIHRLFESQAKRTPGAVALIYKGEQLTYGELNQKANEVARALTEKGVSRGAFIPVLMNGGFDLVISALGIMKTGAAFVPLDTQWPAERIRSLIEDLHCDVIVIDRAAAQNSASVAPTALLVDYHTLTEPAPDPSSQARAEDPIYAIFTSGSTGRPKAAIVPHRGITNRFLWMNEALGVDSPPVVLQSTRHIYDSAVWEIFWPLTNGGKSVIASADVGVTADRVISLVETHDVTVADFVPSLLNQIIPQIAADGAQKMKSLRSLIVGGEEITPTTIRQFRGAFPHVRVFNLYGPTEASIGCVYYEVTGDEGGRIPIGKPITNVSALILDKNLMPAPVGVSGEIYLGGACVGLGYVNDEAKTNAVFVKNPFAEIDGDSLYKTGDLGQYQADGNISFLGRSDNQVKIRGIRVELGEVESILAQTPGAREAVVTARGDAGDNKRLVAYLLTDQNVEVDVKNLRRLLRGKLPEYLIPAEFVQMNVWPLTPSGKIDRAALPEPGPRPESEADYVAPRTKIERAITAIWQEALHKEKVGIHDNFFDLGGHSLLAIQVHSKLQVAFGSDISLVDLFEYPTISALAKYLSNMNGATRPTQQDEDRRNKRAEGRSHLNKRLRRK